MLTASPHLGEAALLHWKEAPLPSRSLRATVLVVDDETPVRRLLRRQLEVLGCTVLEAESGSEALRLILSRRGTLDLVLSPDSEEALLA
jgi:response regulator RpfG family c-di-GMP phosphodiesterase